MLSDRIATALDRAGITQADLARAARVKPPSVHGWLSGKTKHIRGEQLLLAAKALGVNELWLATGDGAMQPSDTPSSQWDTLLAGDEPDPDTYVEIRRVHLRLSAGISGFAIDYLDDDEAAPLWFRRSWLARRSLIPAKLLALSVAGMSMYPGLKPGDTVLVNTASTTPRDGKVFAVNYEGEAVIKRLVRDAGQWWLSSDNPDQAAYPRKLCDEHCIVIGEVVHKQSEEI